MTTISAQQLETSSTAEIFDALREGDTDTRITAIMVLNGSNDVHVGNTILDHLSDPESGVRGSQQRRWGAYGMSQPLAASVFC